MSNLPNIVDFVTVAGLIGVIILSFYTIQWVIDWSSSDEGTPRAHKAHRMMRGFAISAISVLVMTASWHALGLILIRHLPN